MRDAIVLRHIARRHPYLGYVVGVESVVGRMRPHVVDSDLLEIELLLSDRGTRRHCLRQYQRRRHENEQNPTNPSGVPHASPLCDQEPGGSNGGYPWPV